jgi:hypothetical protein
MAVQLTRRTGISLKKEIATASLLTTINEKDMKSFSMYTCALSTGFTLLSLGASLAQTNLTPAQLNQRTIDRRAIEAVWRTRSAAPATDAMRCGRQTRNRTWRRSAAAGSCIERRVP